MRRKHVEKGQTIVIIAISMIGLIAMAALIIDGSNAYLNRRKAQTAADAAALAGAREYCIAKGTDADISRVIQEYALTQNQATAVAWDWSEDYNIINPDANLAPEQIVVTASLEADNFFAKVFNRPTTTVSAIAVAGCFNPGSGKGMLPIAWACKTIEGIVEWDSQDCKFKALDYETELVPLHNSGYPADQYDMHSDIYVIIDSESLPEGLDGLCESEGGYFDCDWDDDGRDDFLGNGDTSWLDLDGKVKCAGTTADGTAALDEWISNGYQCDLSIHTWIPSEPGAPTAAFSIVEDIIDDATSIDDQIFIIPVFNQFCAEGFPIPEGCKEAAHLRIPLPDSMPHDIEVEGQANTYYHIAGFAFFYVSCVHTNIQDRCPGHYYIENVLGLIDHNDKTIEGFFVTGVPIDFGAGGTGGVDLGAYVLSLTQ